MFFVYMLRCFKYINDLNSVLYTGYTNDMDRRLSQHQNKLSKYTSRFDVIYSVYTEEFRTRTDALAREKEIKKLSRLEKEELIISQITI